MKLNTFIPPPWIALVIISIEVSAILFLELNLNQERLFDLNRILISSTGIFAAIVISALMNGFSRLQSDFDKVKEELIPLTDKLTRFRKMLFYILASEDVWGNTIDTRFLRVLRDAYPEIDANTSKYDMDESDPRYQIVNDPRYETRISHLYRTMLTILNVSRREELHFIQRFQHDYSYSGIVYIYESFNNIWYLLAHRPANVSVSHENITRIYRDSFDEELSHFVGKEKVKDFDKYMLSDLGSEFYSNHIPHMALLLEKFASGIPRLYRYLFADLIILISFGLIIPLINNSSEFQYAAELTRFSLSTTIIIYGYIIYHLWQFVFIRINEQLKKYR